MNRPQWDVHWFERLPVLQSSDQESCSLSAIWLDKSAALVSKPRINTKNSGVVTQIFQSPVWGFADYFFTAFSPRDWLLRGWVPSSTLARWDVQKLVLRTAVTLKRKLWALTRYQLFANHLMHVLSSWQAFSFFLFDTTVELIVPGGTEQVAGCVFLSVDAWIFSVHHAVHEQIKIQCKAQIHKGSYLRLSVTLWSINFQFRQTWMLVSR